MDFWIVMIYFRNIPTLEQALKIITCFTAKKVVWYLYGVLESFLLHIGLP